MSLNEKYMAPLPRLVRSKKYAEISGISEGAQRMKCKRGQWLENREYIIAPDGKMMIDWEQVDLWALGGRN